jgi:hypothetical protein
MSYTGVSLMKIGKAMLTPFHASMGLMIAYVFIFAKKGKYHASVNLEITQWTRSVKPTSSGYYGKLCFIMPN